MRILGSALIVFSLTVSSVSLATEKPLVKPDILPVDSDGDGVVDIEDECSFTEAGAKVDERGCYIVIQDTQRITLNVNFAYDSSEIESGFESNIKKVADFMRQYPLTRVIIEGHTDSDGTDAYNLALSKRRALAVAEFLVTEYDLPVDRVTAVGFGEQKPLVDNDTPENKRLNRRVVAVIVSVTEDRL